jgi:tetratricopeptide (TPR) repeat protein
LLGGDREAGMTGSRVTHRHHVAALVLALACVRSIGQPSGDPLAQARSLLQSGALADSEAWLQRYVSAHPASADAHFLLGYVEFREKKAKPSLAEFTAGARYRRPDAGDLKIVASDYVLLGDFADADKWFSEVTRETPQDADAWYLLGRTKYSESGFEEAVSSFERALALHPKYVEAENNLGLSWQEMNQPDKAKTAFQAAIDWQGNSPSDPQPFLNLATLLADEHELDASVRYLTEAVALAPDNPRIHDELAKVYESQNNLAKAQNELEKAVALAPDSSELHFKLGRIYRREGLKDRADKEFALCDKLNSTHSSTETPNPFTPAPASPH